MKIKVQGCVIAASLAILLSSGISMARPSMAPDADSGGIQTNRGDSQAAQNRDATDASGEETRGQRDRALYQDRPNDTNNSGYPNMNDSKSTKENIQSEVR